MKTTHRKRPLPGFTLLEIVIVLGIIAVILGGSIAMLGKIGDGAKVQRVDSDFKNIESALRSYAMLAGTPPRQHPRGSKPFS